MHPSACITALFTIAKTWKQPKCPSTEEWIKKMWYIGSEETRGSTGKTQTYRMDLRTRGGGRVSWDEVREWHGHIYTTKCKIDS